MDTDEIIELIEAIKCCFEGVIENDSSFSVPLWPHACSKREAFVQATIQIRMDGSPVSVSLVDSRGLGDVRESELIEYIEQYQDDGPILLAGRVQDWLTDNNAPDGRCCFCLDPLAPNPLAPGPGHQRCLLLPCGDSFHYDCFASWYVFIQASCREQEMELIQHTGQRTAELLQLSGKIPAKEDCFNGNGEAIYQIFCPSCRSHCPPQDLPCFGSYQETSCPSSSIQDQQDEVIEGIDWGLVNEATVQRRALFERQIERQRTQSLSSSGAVR